MTTAAKIRRFLAKGLSADDVAKRLGIPKARVQTVQWRDAQKAKLSKIEKAAKKESNPLDWKWVTLPDEEPTKLLVQPDHLEKAINVLKTQYIDPVNSPPHYTAGGIETIAFIEAKDLNYRLGNAVKYITRAGKKDSDPVQDLEKAVWYLKREIEARKGA